MPGLTLGDLDERDFARRVAGPGLYLRTNPFIARITTDLGPLKKTFRWLYADYAVADEFEAADMVVDVNNPQMMRLLFGRQALAHVDAPSPFTPLPLRQAPLMLEMALNWCVAMRIFAYLTFHAAVVERGGRALLIPGASGQGKTTLSASLMLTGWRLFSDEFGLFDMDRGQLVPYPRPLSIKNESIEALKSFSDDARFTPSMPETPKGLLAYLRPSAESIHRSIEPAELGWIVFPEFAPEQEPAITPLAKSKTLFGLTRSSVNYDKFAERSFHLMADLVDTVPAYSVRYPDIETALGLIDEVTS